MDSYFGGRRMWRKEPFIYIPHPANYLGALFTTLEAV